MHVHLAVAFESDMLRIDMMFPLQFLCASQPLIHTHTEMRWKRNWSMKQREYVRLDVRKNFQSIVYHWLSVSFVITIVFILCSIRVEGIFVNKKQEKKYHHGPWLARNIFDLRWCLWRDRPSVHHKVRPRTPLKSGKCLSILKRSQLTKSMAIHCNESWKSYKYMQLHNYHRHRRRHRCRCCCCCRCRRHQIYDWVLWMCQIDIKWNLLTETKKAGEQVAVQSHNAMCVVQCTGNLLVSFRLVWIFPFRRSVRNTWTRIFFLFTLKDCYSLAFVTLLFNPMHCHWPRLCINVSIQKLNEFWRL